MTVPTSPLGRVVDRTFTGWYLATDGLYHAGYRVQMTPLPYSELERARGPLRPIRPVPGAELEGLTRILTDAGTFAVGTFAAAAGIVADETGSDLCAGRPGSNESVGLRALLADSDRAAQFALAHLVAPAATILRRWVTDPAGYVEIAETAAAAFAAPAAAGWHNINYSDDWLTQPDTVRAWLTSGANDAFDALSDASNPAPATELINASARLRRTDGPAAPAHTSADRATLETVRTEAAADLDRIIAAFTRNRTHRHAGDTTTAVVAMVQSLLDDPGWARIELASVIGEAVARLAAADDASATAPIVRFVGGAAPSGGPDQHDIDHCDAQIRSDITDMRLERCHLRSGHDGPHRTGRHSWTDTAAGASPATAHRRTP